MSYEQHIDEFEGATISLFIFNEPPPEDIFDACLARMKFGGRVLMPMTPLNNSAWIYDRLVANEGKNGIRVIYGDTEDNCKEHGKNGVIPHAAIQALSDSCDPDDREARLHGKFSHMAGQIFKSFDRAVHVIDIPDKMAFTQDKTIYQVVDPAIGKPLAVIWAAVDNTGVVTIWGEHPNFEFQGSRDSHLTVKDYCDIFRAFEEGRKVHIRILDKEFGNQRRTMGGLTLKQEFGEAGIDFMDSYSIGGNMPEVETGILRVKDYLRYDKTKPIDNLNRPRLYVDKSCINVIHSFERWTRNDKTGKPKEEFKDFSDCVRYLVMANPEMDRPREWGVTTAHYGAHN
jgi:phage terminase large subunit-like protein